jgi:hypothetical protein
MDYGQQIGVVHIIDTVGGGQNELVADDRTTTIESIVFEQRDLVRISGMVSKMTAYDPFLGCREISNYYFLYFLCVNRKFHYHLLRQQLLRLLGSRDRISSWEVLCKVLTN